MKKKLNSLLKLFPLSKKKTIPDSFEDSEKILRSVYSPININKNGDRIKSNAFKPPPDLDEVSVNRLSYTTPDFCKQLSKKNQSVNRKFYGFALLYVKEIFKCEADIVYSPLEENKFHSDIKIGYKPEKGVPLPAKYQKKVKDLTDNSRFFKDLGSSELWEGKTIE